MALSLQGFAQKGMQGVGVNVAGNVHKGFGLGASIKYQYNLSDYIRLEPSFSYYAIIAEKDAFNMTGFANLHLFFSSPNALRPYFFAGAGFVSFKDFHHYYVDNYYYGKKSDDDSGLGLDIGLGLDFRMTHTISLQVEAGAMYGAEKIGGRFNIGLCYNF